MSNSTLADPGYKILNNFVVDICFEQRHPNFAHGRVNIPLGEFSPAAEFIKDTVKSFC
jgi:hypothetical protein